MPRSWGGRCGSGAAGQTGAGVAAAVSPGGNFAATGSATAIGSGTVTHATTARTKYTPAATSSSRVKLPSVSGPAPISPTHAIAVSAEVRPTAFWIAAATPLWAGSTASRTTELSGVMVRTRPAATTSRPR